MKIFQPPSSAHAGTKENRSFYLQEICLAENNYLLKDREQELLCLTLGGQEAAPAYMQVLGKTYELADGSTFYTPRIQVRRPGAGQPAGWLERDGKSFHTGKFQLGEDTYGWKTGPRHEPHVWLINAKRQKLLTFCRKADQVTLLLSGAGRADANLPLLLALCWYMTHTFTGFKVHFPAFSNEEEL